MSLKELTAEKHKLAESTKFMKAVFAKTLPSSLWIDWTYQKTLFYGTIEGCAGSHGLLKDLPDIPRAFYLYLDYKEMNPNWEKHFYKPSTIAYHNYLLSVSKQPEKIMPHLYTWHMGDMFGGQMIKKLIAGSHRSLDFKNVEELKTKIRAKLDDSMGDEANLAFDWAIKLMNEYDTHLE